LFFLKAILHSFSESIGLKVNYQKSFLVPINICDTKALHLANTLGYTVGSLSFTYLGLPLGTSRPRIDDYLPLICKCQKRLLSTSMFLSQVGKLEITDAVLTALPTFHLCALVLPKGVLKHIDKFRKHYLWRGADINSKKISKISWEMVCQPKEEGGLGVIDLKKHNEALPLKNLDNFLTERTFLGYH
jgi:hypothetical protein